LARSSRSSYPHSDRSFLVEQLPQCQLVAPDAFEIQGAVDLPALLASPDCAAAAEQREVPADAWLAHAQSGGQLLDADLALGQPLKEAEAGGAGQCPEVRR